MISGHFLVALSDFETAFLFCRERSWNKFCTQACHFQIQKSHTVLLSWKVDQNEGHSQQMLDHF